MLQKIMPDLFAATICTGVFVVAGVRAEMRKDGDQYVVWADADHPEFAAANNHVQVCMDRFGREALGLISQILDDYVAWRQHEYKPTAVGRVQDN